MAKPERRRPTPWQWLGYCFGRALPDSMRSWVLNDLTGRHAVPRHVVRSLVPWLPFIVGAWFVPGEWWIGGAVSALIAGLALQFAFYLMPMSRRGKLAQHGLPYNEAMDQGFW
jgi:hypothetical protein